jgi:hypothetical protein
MRVYSIDTQNSFFDVPMILSRLEEYIYGNFWDKKRFLRQHYAPKSNFMHQEWFNSRTSEFCFSLYGYYFSPFVTSFYFSPPPLLLSSHFSILFCLHTSNYSWPLSQFFQTLNVYCPPFSLWNGFKNRLSPAYLPFTLPPLILSVPPSDLQLHLSTT